jgi:hypothetical protein
MSPGGKGKLTPKLKAHSHQQLRPLKVGLGALHFRHLFLQVFPVLSLPNRLDSAWLSLIRVFFILRGLFFFTPHYRLQKLYTISVVLIHLKLASTGPQDRQLNFFPPQVFDTISRSLPTSFSSLIRSSYTQTPVMRRTPGGIEGLARRTTPTFPPFPSHTHTPTP